MEHFFSIKLSNGYIALQQRIQLLLSSNPQQYYEEFAKSYPSLLQKKSKKLIAEYLGLSQETLSRLYQHLEIKFYLGTDLKLIIKWNQKQRYFCNRLGKFVLI